ncbi:hypothetical protein J5277_09635 [Rhizobium sp. 16-449-1b]|uniref:hypothetical protein n=1 Tax=Rhizobium sp. 16-449-1b TaxID=2819989 RepID=UPI001ADD46CA|nr:hypothetical protein [Rhizobium sp. 16-449-1b]MBO9194366.1 hypothetical protein [Rhizobium sp. 16-449-1b]
MAQLGATYEDVITGFRGVATGYVQYITGCNQVLLAPRASGELKSEWIDEQRLVIDPTFPAITINNGNNPGCDRAAAKR